MNNTTYFNKDLACIVGIEKSILLMSIWIFVEHNKNTGRNLIDGHYWMYDTAKSFNERFPFMRLGSIHRWMKELEDDGWIVTDNFNKRKNDKTKWYRYGPKLIGFLKGLDSQNESQGKQQREIDVKTDSQNESENLFDSQNDSSTIEIENTDSQIERTNSQNESTLPGKDQDNTGEEAGEEEPPSPPPNENEKRKPLKPKNFNDTEEVDRCIRRLFVHLLERPPDNIHWHDVGEVAKRLVDTRPQLTYDVIWDLIVESFHRTRQKGADIVYLLKVIDGKKNDYMNEYYKMQKKIEIAQAYKDRKNEKKAGVAEDNEEVLKVTREIEDKLIEYKELLSLTAVNEIKQLLQERKWLQAHSKLYEELDKKGVEV